SISGITGKPKGFFGFGAISFVVLIFYVLSGIYLVQPAEMAVVTRFGKFVREEGPGPHWLPHFIEAKTIVNVQEVKTTKHGGLMLTKDENIVSAEIAVQYRVSSARDYLFNVVKPENSLQQVSESAVRAVVGQSRLDEVLTKGRTEITQEIRKQVEEILRNYQAGLEISDLAMQQTRAPEEVKPAFDDAIKAQQDEERLVNEAQAYARKIIPIAEGHATRVAQEADAYKQQKVLLAEGEIIRFAKLLPEYKMAPQVTKDRMFLDTVSEVLSKTTKIIVDVEGSNSLMYLPLDRMIEKRGNAGTGESPGLSELESVVPNTQTPTTTPEKPAYQNYLGRGRGGA
ncbi:MAG TPA: FtsH protease activity modulator HflK, partial [Gammaproteobacteria bacterium]|nr:FtsH protease activity modulator HflK [Gammaproteobacteria bacterium]